MTERLDLKRAREDVRYFCGALGAGLTEWQMAAMRLETRFTAIVAGRQLGKSLTLAWLAHWWSMTRPGSHVLIVSSARMALVGCWRRFGGWRSARRCWPARSWTSWRGW